MSEQFDLTKRAFLEMIDLCGVSVGNQYGAKADCIADVIRFESSLELSGQVSESSVHLTLLAEDFVELFNPVTLNKTTLILEGETMAIVRMDRDLEGDPTVTLYAIGRH